VVEEEISAMFPIAGVVEDDEDEDEDEDISFMALVDAALTVEDDSSCCGQGSMSLPMAGEEASVDSSVVLSEDSSEVVSTLSIDEVSAICHPGVNDSTLRTLRTGAAGVTEGDAELVDSAFRRSAPGAAAVVVVDSAFRRSAPGAAAVVVVDCS